MITYTIINLEPWIGTAVNVTSLNMVYNEVYYEGSIDTTSIKVQTRLVYLISTANI